MDIFFSALSFLYDVLNKKENEEQIMVVNMHKKIEKIL